MTQQSALPKKITMYRGDSLVLDVMVLQGGSPADLTGATVWFTAKRNLTDPDVDAVIQVESPTDITIFDQTTNRGQAQVNVPASVTAVLTEQQLQLFYDVQIKFATGRVATVDFGTLVITPDVTQSIA